MMRYVDYYHLKVFGPRVEEPGVTYLGISQKWYLNNIEVKIKYL